MVSRRRWRVRALLLSAAAGMIVLPVVAAATPAPSSAFEATSSVPADPVIAAAGDIACDPASPYFNGGIGTSLGCHEMATSDLLTGGGLSAVLALGDTQYWCGGTAAYQQSYDPTWGRVLPLTHPVPGNHEYKKAGNTPTGTDCAATHKAPGYFSTFGAAAGTIGQGWYSFDIGTWHLIALNAECRYVGGCGPGSAQEVWLQQDLAAHPTQCTIAFWHQPRFTSGGVGNDATYATFWTDLYAGGADIVLNGHVHNYERFAPQTPAQVADPNGIREFVVGTGGVASQPFGSTIQPNSEVRKRNIYGVLELTLHATGYDWQFVPMAGSTFADSGSDTCH